MFDLLSQKFSAIFSRFQGNQLTERSLEEAMAGVRDALLEADVPYDTIEKFTEEVKKEALGKKLVHSLKPSEQLVKIVHDKLVAFLGGSATAAFSFQLPATIMVIGLQGSGKTTTIGKLALMLKEQAQARHKKRTIMVASVDFYRPAAVDQLEVLAKQAGVLFYRSTETDPILAAKDIQRQAKKEMADVLLLDTAGRLHVDDQMLDELKKIDTAIAPNYKILVLDAMIGQESLAVAKAFNERVGFMGALLTKMDSDTRGGVAFAFKYALDKPIIFAAIGEKLGDIEPFRPERMASRIMGMGDMQTLLERAEQKISKGELDRAEHSFAQGKFNLDDFASQLGMMDKLGSLSSVLQYLPGMGSLKMTPEMLEQGEKELKKFRAILSSMTPKERRVPKILDGSRKKRIALGAGVSPADVNLLLTRFEQSLQFAKLVKKMGNRRF
jgi:signal recognition particle subunit SRP54